MNIYIGNLSYEIEDADLKRIFEVYGTVSQATIINDKFTGHSKGFGFVDMPVKDEATTAIAALDNSDLRGRNIKVTEAKPKESPKPFDRNTFRPRY